MTKAICPYVENEAIVRYRCFDLPEAHQMRSATTLVAASIFLATTPSLGNPIAPDHAFVGTWKITVPLSGGTCDEIQTIRPDGTTLVTSGEEVAESEFEISGPSDKGFYKWVDTITKDNGKKDCLGGITPVGHVATNYVVFHPSKVCA